MPDNFCEAPNGLVYVANGINAVLRWDSLTAQAESAGVAPPVAAMTLSGAGAGGIYGAYRAFSRFVDGYENFSNLSPVSAEYFTSGTTGAITGASLSAPIVLTSAGHGLASGAVVTVQGVEGNTAANDTWTVTVIDADTFSLDGSTGTGTYTQNGNWFSGVAAIVYANVPQPVEPKVVRRQILRNANGEGSVFYVDIDTTDLVSSTLSSSNADPDLTSQTAVPLLDSTGAIFANQYTVPPNHKKTLAHHIDRLWYAAQEDYEVGCVQVAFGSSQVVGVATEWTVEMAGRFFYVVGATKPYQITGVDVANQFLYLLTPYADATDKFAAYAIRPAPAERRLVYYSQAGLPEAVPATNALQVPEDGDEIVGLMQMGSFLYFLETRHIWHFTGQTDPALDGATFLGANRGCINNHCWVIVDDTAYMLDEMGVHTFTGGLDATTISDAIQDLFRPTSEALKYRINWSASRYFHAVHNLPQETIRWFVALSGHYLPRHALCYQYRRKRWWIEEFSRPIGSSCAGRISGVPQVFLGTEARQVQAFWQGFLDGPNPAQGTTRGTVTAASFCTLTDGLAAFASVGLVNNPVKIVAGTGKGQSRTVCAAAATTLTVKEPWSVVPDATSVYQLGAVSWSVRTGWYRFIQSEDYEERRAEVLFRPTPHPATFDLRLYFDFATTPYTFKTATYSKEGAGVQNDANSPNLVCDMTKANGFVQKRIGGAKDFYLDGKRFLQLELRGDTSLDPQSVYQITLDGVVEPRTLGGGG